MRISPSSIIRSRLLKKYQQFFPIYEQVLARYVKSGESVLDVGCGANSPLARIPQRIFRSVGVDLHQESIARSRARKIHDSYKTLDVRLLGNAFPKASFDVILASDVLEHLTKSEGKKLIADMVRIARKRVIILTPNGFIPQEEYGQNPLQKHHSGWSVDELRAIGFSVHGMHGWRLLRGEQSAIRFRPRRVWTFISDISQMIVWRFPQYAFSLFAVKEIELK